MSDQDHADAIKSAVIALNRIVKAASEEGLSICIDSVEYGAIGRKPYPVVRAEVSRSLLG